MARKLTVRCPVSNADSDAIVGKDNDNDADAGDDETLIEGGNSKEIRHIENSMIYWIL